MKQIIEQLYTMPAYLLGAGYDNRLEYIKHLIKLDILEFKSGEEFGTWTVPEEWIVRDAWVKFNGEKIIDYQKEPLSLVAGSIPFQGKVTREELINHLHYVNDFGDANPESIPYKTSYYEKSWGFTIQKDRLYKDKEIVLEDG